MILDARKLDTRHCILSGKWRCFIARYSDGMSSISYIVINKVEQKFGAAWTGWDGTNKALCQHNPQTLNLL